jgi:GNAT superfamily N-acetyltransferase
MSPKPRTRSSSETLQIRPARIEDSARLSDLMRQLGYEAEPAELAARLRRRGEGREVLVATEADEVIAWAAISTQAPFVEGEGAYLEGLIVSDGARSRRIGARLIEAAERWARDRGCAEMRVHTNVVRERAHDFYARHGYATVKAQYYLRKAL